MNVLLFFLCILFAFWNIFDVHPSLTNAPGIVLIIECALTCMIGYISINKLLQNYSKGDKTILCRFYYISFIIGLIILKIGWTPFLAEANNQNWGFDPQRYYSYSIQLIETGTYQGWAGFFGIFYLFAEIMKVTFYDPLVPLYINTLLSLWGAILLSKYCNINNFECNLNIKYFCWLLLIPEVLYYNTMESRETFCMFTSVLMIYSFFKFQEKRKLKYAISLLTGILLGAYIRATFTFTVLLGIITYVLLYSKRIGTIAKFMSVTAIIGAMIVASQLSFLSAADGLEDYYAEQMSNNIAGKAGEFDGWEYGSNSISHLLIPSSPAQILPFGILRSFIYVLPGADIFKRLFNPDDAGEFVGASSSITGFILSFFVPLIFPFIWKNRKSNRENVKLLSVVFLAMFFMIGFSHANFVHHRYRIFYDSVYFALGILSLSYYDKATIKRYVMRWYSAIFCLAIAYFIYKTT